MYAAYRMLPVPSRHSQTSQIKTYQSQPKIVSMEDVMVESGLKPLAIIDVLDKSS